MAKIRPILFVMIATLVAPQAFGDTLTKTPLEVRELSPQVSLEYGHDLPGDILVNPTLKEADVEKYTSGAHYYKQALTSTKPRIVSSTKFVPLPGAKTRIVVPAGKDVLVNVAFTAESRCDEPGSVAPDWCEMRILVDGVEAAPQASSFPPDTYAFDSTDMGTETIASWESHAMDRHKCVFNRKGETNKVVPVEVEWRVTNFDGGVAPNFWLDDWSFTVELAKGCRKEQLSVKQ